MTTIIRDFQTDDLGRFRSMIAKLKRCHPGLEDKDIDVSEEEFLDFIQSHCINALILATESHSAANLNPIGCMMFIPEISLLHACHGFELNEFFIESAYRGSGQGRKMMAELCNRLLDFGGAYIKIVHEDRRNLDQVYKSLGFTNYTKKTNSFHLFMQHGRVQVDEFISQSIDRSEQVAFAVKVVPVHEATTTSLKTHLFSGWKHKLPDMLFNCTVRNRVLPEAQLVLVTCSQGTGRQCLFLEQASVFGWTGVVVIFSGFLGDPSMLTQELLYTRAKVWYDKIPNLSSLEWEIPYNMGGSSSLATSLSQLNVTDVTETQQLNIAFLEGENIRRFGGISR